MADLYKLYNKNYKKRIRISLLKNRERSIKSGHFKKIEANININSKFSIGFLFFILTFSIIPTFCISTHFNTPKQFQSDKSEFISTHSSHPDANNYEDKDNNVEDQSFTEDKEIVLIQEEQESNQQNLLGVSEVKLLKSNEEEIELEFSLSELIIENITAPTGELYKKLSIVDGGCLANIGKPELPTKGIYLDIPVGAKLELQIKSLTFREENGYNIYPYQPSQIDCENNEIPFEKNISAYRINSFYPTKITSIMDVGIIRGHITALLMICPVLYNPYLKKIRLHTKINIQVKFNFDDSDLLKESSIISKKEKYDSEAFQFLFENIYLNYQPPLDSRDDIKLLNKDSMDADGADYLVITADQFYDNILPLAQSKELKGLATVVVNLSEIGTSPTADDISAYVQNAYNTWNPAPSYLLLVGDSNILPVHYKEDMVASDLYYATVDGTDYFPDIFVGRLPVQNNNELDIIIDKIINYEANLNPLDFWRKKVLLASYEESGRFFIITSEAIRQYLETEGYICNTVYTGGTNSGTTADVINCINKGTFLVNHRDHGDIDGWTYPSFKISDIDSLNNGDMLPVMFSINCKSGWFDDTEDCFGEALLKVENKGVVGYIGSTRVSYSGYNDELNKGLITSIWPEFTSGYTNYVGSSTKLGPILNFGKIYMYDKYVLTGGAGYPWSPTETITLLQFEEFNLLGDPELTILPPEINIDRPYKPCNPNPLDGMVGIKINPTLSVDVNDPNGDSMDVYFYNASDDSLIGSDINISDGGTASVEWPNLIRDTNYYWYANVSDGTYITQSSIWSFKTRSSFLSSPMIINEISASTIDYIEMYNYGPDQDMTGWYIDLYNNNDFNAPGGRYYFPDGWVFNSKYVVTLRENTGIDTETVLYANFNLDWYNEPIAVGLFNDVGENMDWFQTSTHTSTPLTVEWIQDEVLILTNNYASRKSDIDTNRASDWIISPIGSMGSLNSDQAGYRNAPDAPSNPFPSNGAIKQTTTIILSVDVFDADSDMMNVYFYNASGDNLIDIDYEVLDGGTASISLSGLSNGVIYLWYVIVDDGIYSTISSTWSFRTNRIPAISNPSPSNGAIEIPKNPTLYVEVSDPDGDPMDVSFYDAAGDILIGTIYGVLSGGTASLSWLGLSENTEYEWYAVASDGTDSTQSAIWSFTIEVFDDDDNKDDDDDNKNDNDNKHDDDSKNDGNYLFLICIFSAGSIIGILSAISIVLIRKRLINR